MQTLFLNLPHDPCMLNKSSSPEHITIVSLVMYRSIDVIVCFFLEIIIRAISLIHFNVWDTGIGLWD